MRPVYFGFGERLAQHMRDAVALVDHFDDMRFHPVVRYRKAGRPKWDKTPSDRDRRAAGPGSASTTRARNSVR